METICRPIVVRFEGACDFFSQNWEHNNFSFNGHNFNASDPNLKVHFTTGDELEFEDVMESDISDVLEMEAIDEIADSLNISLEDAEEIWIKQKENYVKENGR